MKKRLLIIGLGILVLVVGSLVYRATQFRLIDTSPKDGGELTNLQSSIAIVFSKDLRNDQEPKITVKPAQPFIINIEQRQIVLTTGLLPFTRYNVSFEDVQATSGKSLNGSFSFTTGALGGELLAKKQSLLRRLPYTTDDFSIDYVQSSNLYVVDIYRQPVEDMKKAALDFLAGYYITESTDNIEFYVIPAVSGQSGP